MFQNLYKQNFNNCERQEVRRKSLLHQQKLKRLEEQDDHRHHKTIQNHERKNPCYKKNKNSNIENIDLQFSEWFKEKPENLDDWILVPCPKGQRCLVVGEKGKSKMFSKKKKCCMTFSSLIPGGGLIGSGSDYSILDCIYCQEKDTFYVLDALHFIVPLMDCEAEFRFFWLKSKFSELKEFEEKYKYDDVKNVQLLDKYDVSNDACLAMALQTFPLWQDNRPKLDGFLFYHKNSHYTYGTTPLVCWLLPFMLPDVLEMTVSNAYNAPPNYCKENPCQYMNEVDKGMSRRRNVQIHQKELVLNTTRIDDVDIVEENVDVDIDHKNSSLESLLRVEKMLEINESP